jgi:mRNA interferase RelE/StbE
LAWQITFEESAKNEILALDRTVQTEIVQYLRSRIATDQDPRRFGDPLRKELAGLWKYRIGNYRVICDIKDEEVTVLIIRIGHRSKVYGGH